MPKIIAPTGESFQERQDRLFQIYKQRIHIREITMKKRAQEEYKILRHHQVYGTPLDEVRLPVKKRKTKDHLDDVDKPVHTKNRRGILKNVHKGILEKRRLRYQENKNRLKATETNEAREKRLAYMREHMRKIYKSAKTRDETPAEREARIKKSRIRSLKKAALETMEEKNKRCENARKYQKNKIANETADQYRLRIQKNRECYLKRMKKIEQTENEESEPEDNECEPENNNESEPESNTSEPEGCKNSEPEESKNSEPEEVEPKKVQPRTLRSKRSKPVESPEVVKKEEEEEVGTYSSEIVLIREVANSDFMYDSFIKEEPEECNDTDSSQSDFFDSTETQRRIKRSTKDPTFEYDLKTSIDPSHKSTDTISKSSGKHRTPRNANAEKEDTDDDDFYADPFKSPNFKHTAVESNDEIDF